MFEWLLANIGTIIVSFILGCIVALIIVKMYKNKKKGKSLCTGNCAHCSMCNSCHHNK